MRNHSVAGILVSVSVALASAQATPPQGAAGRELTALDYIQIEQLVSKYARAIDTCSNNGYDDADLFTADGSFVPSFNGKPLPPIQGRERLAEVSGGGAKGCKNVPWINRVHHALLREGKRVPAVPAK